MATDYTDKKVVELYAEGLRSDLLSLRRPLLETVGEISGKSILDFGCGYGKYSIIFAKAGARVTAFDASTEQIALAKTINAHPHINYIGEARKELLGNERYDLVFMNMVVPDISTPQQLADLFSFISKIVTTRLIFTALHPFFLVQHNTNFDAVPEFNPKDYFTEGRMFKSSAITGKGREIHFTETHYSLRYLGKLLKQNNFLISEIKESDPVPGEHVYLPVYLIFECVPGK